MTIYLLALSLIASSIFFFTSKTEQSRVVTIHRPMLITQERKTPAYFVYQQTQNLQTKKAESQIATTTYLSNLSMSSSVQKLQVAEMRLNKKEIIFNYSDEKIQVASSEQNLKLKDKIIATKQDFSSAPFSIPLGMQMNEPTVLSPSKKWATIRGKFELIEGVGIIDHYIELKRVEEGQVREIGNIDLKSGSYSIDIESPQGYLIAQIKDRTGGLIGEDREKLVNLQSRGSFLEGPFIRVGQPGTIAANPTINPSYTGGNRSAIATNNKTAAESATVQSISVSLFDNQKTLEKPNDTFSNISKFSTTISRVFDPSRIFRNITTIRHTGEKTETQMFTSKWVSGVIEYISDIQKIEFKAKNGPLIIGRVLTDGKPTAEVQVHIDSAPGVVAVYFDQFMIPNFNQNSTSENGYFMFVGLEANNYKIVATKNNVNIGSQMFIAEEDSVAFQNISSTSMPVNKTVRTFDAFALTPIDSDVVVAELEESLGTVGGSAVYRTHTDSSVGEFLVRSNFKQYLPIRYTQNTMQDHVHVPLIQESWVDAIKKYRQIEEKMNTGTIIGFTTDFEYDAFLTAEEYNKNDIVYFNSQGQVSSEPVVGGGFILFNVPAGARELVLQEKNSDRIYSQVFNIVSEQVSVTHFAAD